MVFAHHRLAGFAAEGFLEFLHVHYQPVYAILAWRVGIGDGIRTLILRANVFAGPLRIADEEPLLWRESVSRLEVHVLRLVVFFLIFPRHPGKDEAAKVG